MVTIRFGGRKARKRRPTDSISEQARRRVVPPRWLVLFFSAFLLIGSIGFYAFFIRPVLKVRAARHWVATPCVVVSSQVRRHRGSKGTTYSIEIVYTYRFAGADRVSRRYDFLDVSSSGRVSKKAVVDRYPKGKRTVCYVDPQNPDEAVLQRDLPATIWVGLLPLIFVLVGMGGIVFTIRARRKKRKALPAPSWQPAPQAGEPVFGLPTFTAAAEPVVLRAKHSRVAKFLGVTAAALFWNGIVALFVSSAIAGWRTGQGDWFLTLFLVPFVLIGLGLIGGVLYMFLGLFNPRAQLVVSSTAVPLGGTLDVKWEIFGRSHLIQQLRLYLEGREEATYQRGTSTSTDRHTFAEIDIAETTAFDRILSGQASVAIPGDTMHSFESDNNKIIWLLRVRGEIAWWPDVKDDFGIVIRPLPLE